MEVSMVSQAFMAIRKSDVVVLLLTAYQSILSALINVPCPNYAYRLNYTYRALIMRTGRWLNYAYRAAA